jgi:pimeloyl-ACP methyl ester carboxylesterase
MTISSVVKGALTTLAVVIVGVIALALSPLILLIEMTVGPLLMMKFKRGDTPYVVSDAEEAQAYDPWTVPQGTEKVKLTGWEGQPLWAYKTLNWDNSRPTLLLLHGWPDDATEWADLLTEMHKRGTVNAIALSQRGSHKETLPDKNGTSGYCMAKDIEAIFSDERSGLSKDHKVHLVGHDWGGYFAAITVRKFPELFETVSFVAVPYARFFFNAVLASPRQALSSWYFFVMLTPFAKQFLLGQYRCCGSKKSLSDFGSVNGDIAPVASPAEKDVEAASDPRIANAESIKTGLTYLLNSNSNNRYTRKTLVYGHAKMLDSQVRKASVSYYSNNLFNVLFGYVLGYSLIGYLFPENQRITARINNVTKVSVPSLSVGCAHDHSILSSTVKRCANPKHFPKGVRYVELKDSGHWPMVEATDKLSDLVEAMAVSGLEGVDKLGWN